MRNNEEIVKRVANAVYDINGDPRPYTLIQIRNGESLWDFVEYLESAGFVIEYPRKVGGDLYARDRRNKTRILILP